MPVTAPAWWRGPRAWRLGLMGALGVILLLVSSCPFGSPASRRVTEEAGAGTSDPELVRYGQALARELELTLSTVRGAGKVCVQVALRSGPETELAANNVSTTRQTQETDATGTSRQTSEHTQDYRPVMSRTAGGLEAPVVTAVRPPAIEGVLVVAEGALDSRVRAELTRAVATLLQLPVYRIRVLPMKGGE